MRALEGGSPERRFDARLFESVARTHPEYLERGALLLLGLAVTIRAWAFVIDGLHFDSDQAVIGIMARDLAHARALPWFTYGRCYMLAISAWLAAPLFALFGSSVALLKLPLALLNGLTVVLLWRGLRRSDHASPGSAFVSILPFAMTGVVVASRLVEQGGGNIEPFVFLVAGYLLRRRPVLLGLNFGVAYLNREFAVIGLVALVLMDVLQRRIRSRLRDYGVTLAVLLAVNYAGRWIATLAPNYFGPGVEIGSYSSDSIAGLFKQQLPILFGAKTTGLEGFNIHSPLSAGHDWLYPVIVGWVAIVVVVLAFVRRLRLQALDGMATYLIVVAGGQGLAFILFCSAPFHPMLIRYVLVLLLGGVGLVALAMHQPLLRAPTLAMVTLLTLCNLSDHVALLREHAAHPVVDEHAVLARALRDRGIKYAQADDYWVAYHVSFLAKEHVLINAPHDQRIRRYREAIDAHRSEVVSIREHCRHGIPVARWNLCLPKSMRP